MEHSTHHQNQEYHMNLNQGATYKTQNQISRSSSSLGSRSVMWLGRMPQHATSKFACLALSFARSCLSSIYPSCLSTASMISLAVCSCPSGHKSVPSVVFEAVDVPCPGPFIQCVHIADYDFCPLFDPDVGPSVLVCDVEHTSFHFGLCGCKFVLCLFGQCPGVCTICHSWQHTGVVGETGGNCNTRQL